MLDQFCISLDLYRFIEPLTQPLWKALSLQSCFLVTDAIFNC